MMKRLVMGILAHVDAGKTTLSEGMLYAEAHEVFNHKRLANCEVRITTEAGALIATFNGTGYRKDTALPFEPIG